MNPITPLQLKEWQAAGKQFLLVDIREEHERKQFNIGGIHIPVGTLFSKTANLPKDQDIVLYCEKGVRSVIAIQRLEASGFENLYNLSGGMKAWKELL